MEQGRLRRAQGAAQAQAGLVNSPQPLTEIRIRDLALFDLAIDSKLRGCDFVRLRIDQLVVNAAAWHRATIGQQTQKPVQFELFEQMRESLATWLTHCGVACGTSCSAAASVDASQNHAG